MSNWLNMLAVEFKGDIFDCDYYCALLNQLWYGIVTALFKVAGLFADLMHVAFYIVSGIDLENGNGANMYDIKVGDEKKNILDYFVFNEVVQKAYLLLAIIGLVLIVIFTIYKIVKQDYFDKAGPRSKGPIFRNVAISCISFLLVFPIFYLIIHVSSLLAVAVTDALGMDSAQFAGATIFKLSWSDGGEMFMYINGLLNKGGTNSFKWMAELNDQTLFTICANRIYVSYDTQITGILDPSGQADWTIDGPIAAIKADGHVMRGEFYWYIYIVGVIVAIKALYVMLMAMIQRLFKLMALFIVAPSPISQYVLDDGQKYKSWLAQSIQEGLRLVVATMSFGIYILVLQLVGKIDFVSAFQSATEKEGQASLNITTSILADTADATTGDDKKGLFEIIEEAVDGAKEWGISKLFDLANAFLRMLLIIAAGGAIKDLDPLLTPLISGGKSSLDAGNTGAAADGFVKGVAAVGMAPVGAMAGALGGAWKNRRSRRAGEREGRKEEEKDYNETESKVSQPESSNLNQTGNGGSGGGGSGGGGSSGGGSGGNGGTSVPTQIPEENQSAPKAEPKDQENDGEGVSNPENQENGGEGTSNSNNEENNEQVPKNQENTNDNNDGQPSEDKPRTGLFARLGNGIKNGLATVGGVIKAAANTKVGKGIRKGVGTVAKVGGKTVLGAGRTAVRTVGAGAKAMFNAAKSQILTAVVGKDLAKQYTDSKAAAEEDARQHAVKDAEKAKERGYRQARKERINNKIEETKKEKAAAVTQNATNLGNTIQAEDNALDDKNKAEAELRAKGGEANEANSELEAVANSTAHASGESTEKIEEDLGKEREKIDKYQKEIKGIEESYGSEEAINAQIAGAKQAKDTSKVKELTAVKKMLQGRKKGLEESQQAVAVGETKLEQRKETAVVFANKDNKLDAIKTKYGLGSDASYDDIVKKVQAGGDDGDKAIFNDENHALFNTSEAENARKANSKLNAAQASYATANSKYESAQNSRRAAESALSQSTEEYKRSVSVIKKLDEGNKYKVPGKNKNRKFGDDFLDVWDGGVAKGSKPGESGMHRDGLIERGVNLGRRAFRRGQDNKMAQKIGALESEANKFTTANSANSVASGYTSQAKSVQQHLDDMRQAEENKFASQTADFESKMTAEFGKLPPVTEHAVNVEDPYKNVTDNIKSVSTNKAHNRVYGSNPSVESQIESNIKKSNNDYGDNHRMALHQFELAKQDAADARKNDFINRITSIKGLTFTDEQMELLNGCKNSQDAMYITQDEEFWTMAGASTRDGYKTNSKVMNQVEAAKNAAKEFANNEKTGKHLAETTRTRMGELYTERLDIAKAEAEVQNAIENSRRDSLTGMLDKHSRGEGTSKSYNVAGLRSEVNRNGGNQEMLDLVNGYAQQKSEHQSRMQSFTSATNMINAFENNDKHFQTRGQEIVKQYYQSANDGRRMQEIINSGGKNITADDRRIIGSTLGLSGGKMTTSNPETIVQQATQVRDIKTREQQVLIQRGDELASQKTINDNSLSAALDALAKGLGQRNISGQTAGQPQQNVNNVTNNNIMQQGAFTPFDSEQNQNRSGELPASSGLGQSNTMEAMYERMQVEGVKHMEQILTHLQTQINTIEKSTENTERIVKNQDSDN